MSKLPLINARRLEKFLLENGFVKVRQKGSHVFYRHPDGRYTTIAHHRAVDVPRSLIRSILREAGLSVESYLEFVTKKKK